MHVSAVDVAASSPFSQAQAVKGQASQPLGGCAAPSSKPDAAGAEQADSKAASPPDGSEEELAPGLLPKLPWRENPLITKGPFILIQELCERLAYNGIATNIVTYLKDELQMSSSQSATLTQIWSGTCYLTPLLGAFIADTWLGRFRVILSFSCIYMLGLVGLLLSAALPGLKPQQGEGATSASQGVFWAGMYLVALGEGGIKPCVMPFGADQFDETDPRQAKRVPQFFSVSYAAINTGTLITLLFVVNIQTSVSWAAGFAVILGAFVIATTVFVTGSIVAGYRCVVGLRHMLCQTQCIEQYAAQVPADGRELHEVEGAMSVVPGQLKLPRTASFKFLEKAAVRTKPAGTKQRLVTLTEGQGMDTSLGSLNLAPATLKIVPWCAKRGRPITTLRRIGAGYIAAMLGMVAAAVVEIVRLDVVARHGLQGTDPTADGSPEVPMSVWWQAIQAPDAMRSFCSALQVVCMGLGSYVAAALVAILQARGAAGVGRCPTCERDSASQSEGSMHQSPAISTSGGGPGWIASNVNEAHLDFFFWTLLVLMFLNFLIFLRVSSCFRYRVLPHATVGVEALALTPDYKSGVGLTIAMSATIV
ncbi:hypothetical protein COHA_008836 [Chlorella ohadii]|uniref:Uncharacterized protein n=1 Tax=Chlorella ohadii TaxID=2649997 RepID=A0AAD5GYE9_9CHLO|nr:hypothetical protein COHA_008836 [Chlorella ohadii]